MNRFDVMQNGDATRGGQRLPLGYSSWEELDELRGDLAATIDGIVIRGRPISALALQIGMSTTFYAENPKKPLGYHFDVLAPDYMTDIDIEVYSPELVEHMIGLDPILSDRVLAGGQKVFFKNHAAVGAGFHAVFPQFADFCDRWSTRLGREVDVKLRADLTPVAHIRPSARGPIEVHRRQVTL